MAFIKVDDKKIYYRNLETGTIQQLCIYMVGPEKAA